MIQNKTIRSNAKGVLSEKWLYSAAVLLLYGVIVGAASNFAPIGTIFLGYPLIYGISKYYMALAHGYGNLEQLFDGFRERYLDNVTSILLRDVFVLLWSLLLIIPGIIKSLSYALVPYILVDKDFNVYGMEALKKSEQMMDGFKWQYFKLMFHFFLLHLLGLLTLGILNIFYVSPYQYSAMAQFFYMVKENDKEIVTKKHHRIEQVVEDLEKEIIVDEDEWDF